MPAQELFPVFNPQIGDINNANKYASVIDMSQHRNPAAALGEAVEDFLTSPEHVGSNPDLTRYRERLNGGGTLVNHEVQNLAQHHREFGTQVKALKTRLHHPADAPVSIKAYKGKKAGKAAHRDANFTDSGPASIVDAIGLRGAREFGIWVVPQLVDLGVSDVDFMSNADRQKAIVEFSANLDGRPRIFRPIRTFTFGPGQGVRVNERDGVWLQPAPSRRQMAVWHSVYGLEGDDGRPVLSAVMRSNNPGKL